MISVHIFQIHKHREFVNYKLQQTSVYVMIDYLPLFASSITIIIYTNDQSLIVSETHETDIQISPTCKIKFKNKNTHVNMY